VRRSDAFENLLAAVYERIAVLKGIAVDFSTKVAASVVSVVGSHVIGTAASEILRDHLV
jgi:hypothetical protein